MRILVAEGERVKLGQMLSEPLNGTGVPSHAPASGTVVSIAPHAHPCGVALPAAEIETDGINDDTRINLLSTAWPDSPPDDLAALVQSAGIVGSGSMNGSAYARFQRARAAGIDTLIVNAVECEPFTGVDQRMLIEHANQILIGAAIVARITGAKNTCIAVAGKRPGVMSALQKARTEGDLKSVTIVKARTRYPQGNERVLCTTITKREIPAGQSIVDVGCLIISPTIALAVHEVVTSGQPFVRCVVSVAGPGVARPAVLRVPIGTSIRALLEYCQADFSRMKKVLVGGPLSGSSIADLDAPVTKTTSAIVALTRAFPGERSHACISCSMCMRVCPMHLVPAVIAKHVERNRIAEAAEWNVHACIACGCCAYVCPSRINLVHYMRLGASLAPAPTRAPSARTARAAEPAASPMAEPDAGPSENAQVTA